MRILVVGNGAREHALVWKIKQSPKVSEIYVAPGNGGTAAIAHNLDIPATDVDSLVKAARKHKIDLAVIGPEATLGAGIVDRLDEVGIPAFGPRQAGAQIECSKVFSKELMVKYGIPCAASRTFTEAAEARRYTDGLTPPFVIKADGLAAGKGAVIINSHQEARQTIADIMEKRVFGAAGERVLIEEYLEGREVSFIAFTDGDAVAPMVPACDYKRVFDGDKGPNTGGMGSFSPPPFFTPEMARLATDTVLKPTVKALAAEGAPYKGALYAGLMLTKQGLKVLEFNARFGDPETQVILPRLKTDLMDILLAVAQGTLGQIDIEWRQEACVGVVMASGGYPGSYPTGLPITGLEKVDKDIMVFHAGTRLKDGWLETSGGRVLTVASLGHSLAEARQRVYANLPHIRFEGAHYRKDIASGL